MEPLSASPPPEQSSLSLPEPRPPSVVVHREMFTEMEVRPRLTEDHSSVWDLGCLLDFNLDDQIAISVDYDHNSEVPEPLELPPLETRITERIRKRDPRLTCSNYLAGRVPCACPEMDEKLEEEGLIGNKRARITRASAGVVRCQVRGCEADISELKGYHRRHRVCLRCANASSVMLDGEAKRYCQQCGKFHILSDFDEGKRSCRRKLERHNNRRRRKPTNSRAAADHELQPVTRTEDVKFDGQAGKACSYLSSEINENGELLEHQVVHISQCLAPDSQNINSDGVVSYVASGETQATSGKDNSNFSNSPSYCEKSAYTSMCPTGRISFKLYDWNPAEFPRRLRHQIFEWLANMPVELEGYIRPGCTILTTFIAMPKVMWINLLEDPPYYVRDLVSPGKMLSRRGAILVHLNDMIFHVIKDETSMMKVEINKKSPRLHYVHPTYFEAGKPMEFVVCGSNLLQPKFRLLLSFSGEYLKYEYFVSYPHNWTGDNISCAFDNQLYKIYVPNTEPNLIGPAFIEVENESGLSNFIPVLVGDQGICSEMKTLQQNLDVSIFSKQFPSTSSGSICSSCEAFALRNTASSDLLLDIAWLLKDPTSDKFHRAMTALQIQRFYSLLDFLICNDSTIILEKILQNLMILTENMKSSNLINRLSDFDMTLLLNRLWYARDVLYQKNQKVKCSVMPSVYSEMEGYKVAESYSLDNSQGAESRADAKLGVLTNPISNGKSERIPLLKREEVIMNMEKLPRKSGHWPLARGILSSQRGILVIASVAVCVGLCAALFHHEKVGESAVSIGRCLFNYS